MSVENNNKYNMYMVSMQWSEWSALILPFLRRYQSPRLSHDLWHPTECIDTCTRAIIILTLPLLSTCSCALWVFIIYLWAACQKVSHHILVDPLLTALDMTVEQYVACNQTKKDWVHCYNYWYAISNLIYRYHNYYSGKLAIWRVFEGHQCMCTYDAE